MTRKRKVVRSDGSRFGWCLTGHHEQCRREFRPFWIEGKRLRYRDDLAVCACSCHENEEEKRS